MDNNLNLKIGDRVIKNYENSLPTAIGTVVNITEKRGDYVVDYGNYKETYRYDGCQRGVDVWNMSHIILPTMTTKPVGVPLTSVIMSSSSARFRIVLWVMVGYPLAGFDNSTYRTHNGFCLTTRDIIPRNKTGKSDPVILEYRFYLLLSHALL